MFGSLKNKLAGNFDNIKSFGAFTLAEVLITLAIIGVVAALTIPTLMQKTRHAEEVTALKKAYTSLSQALISIANDYGCVGDLKCTGLFSGDADSSKLGNAISAKYKVAKNCLTESNKGCLSNDVKFSFDNTVPADKANLDTGGYKFVTADGVGIVIYNDNNNCGTIQGNSEAGPMSQSCGQIFIDINGLSKPNFFGRDVFHFYITNGKGPQIYPDGGPDDKAGGSSNYWRTLGYCDDNAENHSGFQCAGRIMEEGWQMNY